MTNSRPPCLSVPGVVDALRWLFSDPRSSDHDILEYARTLKLITEDEQGEHWSCDGSQLENLIALCAKGGHHPDKGSILAGLGEMLVRSHASTEKLSRALEPWVLGSDPKLPCIVSEALDIYEFSSEDSEPSLLVETDSTSVMDWGSIALAEGLIRRPPMLTTRCYAYGVQFVSRLLLHSSPQKLPLLIREATSRHLVPQIVKAIAEECICSPDAAEKALDSHVPLFVGLGIFSLREYSDGDGAGWKSSALDSKLADASVEDEGRIRLSAATLKSAVHAWYRQKNRLHDNRCRQALLSIEPTKAHGGEPYAKNEITGLEKNELRDKQVTLSVQRCLIDALKVAASLNHDPSGLWEIFEPSFVDTPEIAYRFAKMHPSSSLKKMALTKALNSFLRLICANQLDKAIQVPLEHIADYRLHAFWAAKTQVLLSLESNSDVGHDVAKKIMAVERVVKEFSLLPLAAHRFGTKFSSTATRWAMILQFTFFAFLLSPNPKASRLRDHSLESARLFIPVASRSLHDQTEVKRVISLTVDAVLTCKPSVIQNWLDDNDQPQFLHILLIWSHFDMLHAHEGRAKSLIDEFVSSVSQQRGLSNVADDLFNILDRACESMFESKIKGSVKLLEFLFNTVTSFENVALAKTLEFETIVAAVNSESCASDQILNDITWGSTRLARSIRRKLSSVSHD